MFSAYTRPRYQVSVHRTIGPLVIFLGCNVFVLNFFNINNACICYSIIILILVMSFAKFPDAVSS